VDVGRDAFVGEEDGTTQAWWDKLSDEKTCSARSSEGNSFARAGCRPEILTIAADAASKTSDAKVNGAEVHRAEFCFAKVQFQECSGSVVSDADAGHSGLAGLPARRAGSGSEFDHIAPRDVDSAVCGTATGSEVMLCEEWRLLSIN
jgi:hypothetical protein